MELEASVAVQTNNVENLKKLLSGGLVKNINAQDHNGQTLLHHATINGHGKIIVTLLEHGANTLIRDQEDHTVLHLATVNCKHHLAQVILDSMSRDELRKLLDMKIEATGYSALHIAAESNCLRNASVLLHYGANFELTNKAGKKPIDITRSEELRELLQLTDSVFAKAKHGDVKLLEDLKLYKMPAEIDEFTPISNCKNDKGHTLMEILIRQKYNDLALDFLWWRLSSPVDLEQVAFYSSDRQDEVDRLAELTRKCHNFWTKGKSDLKTIFLVSAAAKCDVKQRVVKIVSDMLEIVHEMLLAYREFNGKLRHSSSSLKLSAMEELFEILLGIDPTKRLCVKTGKGHCYYEKLPTNWKKNIVLIMDLIDVIRTAIEHFLRWINKMCMFRAVEANNVDKVQQLVKDHKESITNIDPSGRTVLCHAVERGDKKIVRMLLKAGAKMTIGGELSKNLPPHILNRWKFSFCKTVAEGNVKMVKLLLEKSDVKDVAEMIDTPREDDESTPMHVAAKLGRLDIVKILLKYGATYWILDANVRTPMEVSTNEEVTQFLKLVDACFQDAKKANVELLYKLKAMETDEFLAIAGTKNHDDQTLAVVAAKANGKNIACVILKMIREAKKDK